MLVTLINSKSSSLPPPVLMSKPSDPSLPPPFPKGLFPFTAWSPRATPAAGCEESVCQCVFVTIWVFFFLEGGGLCPTPYH